MKFSSLLCVKYLKELVFLMFAWINTYKCKQNVDNCTTHTSAEVHHKSIHHTAPALSLNGEHLVLLCIHHSTMTLTTFTEHCEVRTGKLQVRAPRQVETWWWNSTILKNRVNPWDLGTCEETHKTCCSVLKNRND